MAEEIKVGDKVRSYDHESARDWFYEGVVMGLGEFKSFPDCARYKIRVSRYVRGGKDTASTTEYVFPPVNGTPTLTGKVMNNVEKIDD